MTAALKIVTEEADDVLTVPNRALHFEPRVGASLPTAARSTTAAAKRGTVWTEGAEGRLIPVDIETGASDDNRTQVIAGDLRERGPRVNDPAVDVAVTPHDRPPATDGRQERHRPRCAADARLGR